MSGVRGRAALSAVLLVLAGCGGSGEESSPEGKAKTPPEVVREANANCRQLQRDARALGEGVLSRGYEDELELVTEGLIAPGIPLLQRFAVKQQALAERTRDSDFDLYARLFDPIVVLTEERLRVGRALPDYLPTHPRTQAIEDNIDELTLEQRDAARAAGLPDCDVDFRQVLVSSLTG